MKYGFVIEAAGSSPHTRGARQSAEWGQQKARIIPAYAGSTGSKRRPAQAAGDHPRIRGEHGATPRKPWIVMGSSPHTRGARWLCGETHHCRADHPRIRGEHDSWPETATRSPGSSPHTRGARVKGGESDVRHRIIPAYAGSTPAAVRRSPSVWDHPRIRGEHAVIFITSLQGVGSSPHTRGAQKAPSRGRGPVGIIPAYAGSTRTQCTALHATRDHPRIRGEHLHHLVWTVFVEGSSPHTRGALHGADRFDGDGRIIPAYAGSTRRRTAPGWRPRDHPRIRGEHGDYNGDMRKIDGSSPHTRGAPAPGFSIRPGAGIIPAYAGSTRCHYVGPPADMDHPRIRGEHNGLVVFSLDPHGSSPHTRGAHKWDEFLLMSRRIIPAYAGSTIIGPDRHTVTADHPRIRGEH